MHHERLMAFARPFLGAASLALAACATTPPQVEAETPAAATPVKKRASVKPDALLGAKPKALDRILGEPSLTRREGAGEFRRYAMGQCMLIVILYTDDGGDTKVVHLDAAARQSGAQKPAVEDCLEGNIS